MKQPLTTSDWLATLRAYGPALRQRVWAIDNRGRIRTTSGQCPLCALAEIHSAEAAGLSLAWGAAIKRAWGDERGFGGAFPVAMAADNEARAPASVRKALLTILGLRHDC